MNPSKLHDTERIASIQSDEQFQEMAREVFEYQRVHCLPYQRYLKTIGWHDTSPASPPFLPIEAFKHERVSCEDRDELIFKSSGTTGVQRSKHHVHNARLYRTLSQLAFERLLGKLTDWTVLALLPSYVEQGDSSLVYMVNSFIAASQNPHSEFVSFNADQLNRKLRTLKQHHQKTLLIGVSYALLDFVREHSLDSNDLHIMETGGMKGRGKELTRQELHEALRKGFPSSPIHSEYGMTELLSQAYSINGTAFKAPAWMKVYATDVSDPFKVLSPGERGVLAFIDLANIHSCSFIQTRDIGFVDEGGAFTIEGRLDNSDLRGCNLLYT